MVHFCTHCRQPLDDNRFGGTLYALRMGKTEKAVADALAKAKGFHVSVERLGVCAYGVSHRMSDDMVMKRIRAIIHSLRKKASIAGYAIDHEHGSGYCFRRISQAPTVGGLEYRVLNIL